MAFFNTNRFPMESCNQNTQWINSPMQPTGISNCVQPFQRPPTPTIRPQQHEGFTQYSGHHRLPFSNVPPQAHPPGFSNMLPPNNQAFTVNVNTPQNFPSTPDHRNFVRTPDPQNFPRMLGPQNFTGAHNSQNFLGAPGHQNLPGMPGAQNFSGAPNPQSIPGAPISQHFSGAPNPQNFPGAPSAHNFHGATGPQSFPVVSGSQTFPSVSDPQNFPRPFHPQNFPRAPDPQILLRPPDSQNFLRPPNHQNFQRPLPRPPDHQNFQRPPDQQNFPRPPDPQNFSRPPDPQNFPRPPTPQNFPRPPDPQNFPRPPDPQNFPRPPDPQNFSRPPDPQNFCRGFDFTNFPQTHFSAVPNQPNFQGDSNPNNFSKASGSLNFPRASNPQGFQRMPVPQNFNVPPDLQHPYGESSVQNFDEEHSFEKFPQTSGSSPRPFTPWKRFSSGGQRTQFQNRSWEPSSPRKFRDFSSQENEFQSSQEREFQFHRRGGGSKFKNFKKLKEDNKEKPFFCDTCDRAFVTETDLKDHISQHTTCDHANCTFEAHPKIVALHKRMQHDTGYAERINKLKDAEEIKKWREERKRRFPTAENIKKRQAEQAEREARGEVLETKEFGKFKRRKEDNEINSNNQRRRGRRFKRHNDRRQKFTPRSQTFAINVDSETDSDCDSHITLHRFSGMLSFTNSICKDTDDMVKDSTLPQANSSPVNHDHALQNLSEQNMSKSQLEDDSNQSGVPCSDSYLRNQIQDKTVQLNDEEPHDAISSTVVKALDDKSGNEQSLSNVQDSDDEAPVSEPIVKSTEKSVLINEGRNENKDINVSVCEIPHEKSETEQTKNVELVEVADSDDEAPTVVPISKSFENSHPEDDKSNQNTVVDQKSLPESSKNQEKVAENGYGRNHNKNNRYSRNQQNGHNFVQVARKSSLLEKLLADDIRHERNVILQCIRHIVKNNFFGIENNSHK